MGLILVVQAQLEISFPRAEGQLILTNVCFVDYFYISQGIHLLAWKSVSCTYMESRKNWKMKSVMWIHGLDHAVAWQ